MHSDQFELREINISSLAISELYGNYIIAEKYNLPHSNMSFDIRIPALESIAASLAQLVPIFQTWAAQQAKNMISAADVKAIIDDFNAVVLSKATEDTALAGANTALLTAQQNLAALQQSVADLNDPALASSLATALANAAAATPPANPVVNAPPIPINPGAPVVPPGTTDPVTGAPIPPTPTNPDGTPVVATNPDGTPVVAPTPVPVNPNAPQV